MEEVAAVVATADRNQKIVAFVLALKVSGGWIFKALGYGMRRVSPFLVCNIIPKYLILVIDSNHDLEVIPRCSDHSAIMYTRLILAIRKSAVQRS